MAVSEVSICNQALSWLGEKLITSLDDPTTPAQLCKLNYEQLRDAVLEARDWSFAMQRNVPAVLVTVPVWGYSHQFQLPPDLLRVVFVGETDSDLENQPVDNWQREQDKIMCNVDTIYLRYIYRLTDPVKFTPLFVQALAARIAADLAMPLTSSRSLQSDMFNLFGVKLQEAAATDAKQGRTRVIRSQDLSVNSRLMNRAV